MAAEKIYAEMAAVLRKNQQEVVKLWVTQINAGAKQVMEIAGEEWVKRFAIETTEAFLKALPAGVDIETRGLPTHQREIRQSELRIRGEGDFAFGHRQAGLFRLRMHSLPPCRSAIRRKS